MQSNSVMTLSNSIIGVSILAMPFCFQQCGIILSLIILFLTSIISRLACHFLLKSAIISRCRSFEFLAFHIFGPAGKTVIELSIVGFLMGSCVAFFVVVGDLGPVIVKSALNLETSVQALRPALLVGVAVFIVLPLGLVRDIDSLSSICTITIGFYIILVLKIILEATPPIFASSWADKVNFWRPAGILQCLPIFSSALSCQTQLFEIFGSYLNGPLDKINSTIKSSVNMCTAVYMGVGLFGYIAFCSQPLTGNALMNFPPSISGDIIKLGFVVSVALSFPLVIFPCRASLYSFLYHQTHSPHYELLTRDTGGSSQNVLTLIIVTISLILALLVPSIELVLGLLGSTIGVILCYILPSVFFTRLLKKNTNERLLAQVVIVVGVFIMVLGTYVNLFATEEALSGQEKAPPVGSSLKFPAPSEKEFLSEVKLGLEEPKRQVDEPFLNEQQKANLDQVKVADDIKKDLEPVKLVNDIRKDSDQEKLVDSLKKDSDHIKLAEDMKKGLEDVKSADDIKKEIRKEPLEPVAPLESKKVVVDVEQAKEPDLSKKPDDLQYANNKKLEMIDHKEILQNIPLVLEAENLAEKSPNKKSEEKQIENPNESNKENIVPPPKVEKQDILLSKARKARKPKRLGEANRLRNVGSLPNKDTTNVVNNNNVNSKGNLKPEIIDKLKDTVPLPIALQKNINVFNVSASQNTDALKKVSNSDDKVINRDLLGQQNGKDPLDRERRDVHTSSMKTVLDGKQIGSKLSDNKNESAENGELVVRSFEPTKKVNTSKLTPVFEEGKIVLEKNKLPSGYKVDNKIEDMMYRVEGTVDRVNENREKQVSSVREIDVLVGHVSALNLEVKEENIIPDKSKQDVVLIEPISRTDKKSEQLFGQSVESESEHQPGSKKKNIDQSFKSNPNVDEPSNLDLANESPSKGETLKEVLKNSNSASAPGDEACPKNKTIVEKTVALANNKTQPPSSNRSDLSDSSSHLNIQSVVRLSNPDNLLENFQSVDVQIRDAFKDVAKPLKRDLKSLEANLHSSVSNERALESTLNIFKNLDDIISKKIEIEDNR